MKHFQWNPIWGYCRTSARDQAVFLRTVHRLVPRPHRDFAMRQLARVVKWQRSSHTYGKETLRGVFRRLLRDLPR